MQSTFYTLTLILAFIFASKALDYAPSEQTRIMNNKLLEYQDIMNLDITTIQSNCVQVKKDYETSIEAYDFIQTFTIEAMEETLQNIGKLRMLGNDLEQQATATFESITLRDQLQETRNQRRLEELQWRVNWSATAKSSNIPSQQINEMKEEITLISGDKQKELDDIIQQKSSEQAQLTEQIQLGEKSYNRLNADKEDLKAEITVLNDRIDTNVKQFKEIQEANLTRGDKLKTLLLQLTFFENEKKNAISFNSIKSLAHLQIRTQDEINSLKDDIEFTNSQIILLQEQDAQINDNLNQKKDEMEKITTQMETINTELLQIKQQSETITNLIENKKNEQQSLLLQRINKSVEAEKQIEEEQDEKKERIINEVEELIRQYEELIYIKEQNVEEQLSLSLKKEEIVNKKEIEINDASEKIKQEVKKCKDENRQIITESNEIIESTQQKLEEQDALRELTRLNTELKEEFIKEGEIFKSQQAVEERQEKVKKSQAQLDIKLEEIDKKIFKDIPVEKKSDKIRIDTGGMSASNTKTSNQSYQKIDGSNITLAYPLEAHNLIKINVVIAPQQEDQQILNVNQQEKNESIVPQEEDQQILKEEDNVRQQQKNVEEQQKVIQEQQEEIIKERKQIQLREQEIKQKEENFEQKKAEIQQEIQKLDEEIAHCKLIQEQEDEQSQEYQMCQWQSTDYEQKKKQLEQMQIDYQNSSQEFIKTKQQFYQNQSFLQVKDQIANKVNILIQLANHNNKGLAKSMRHKSGMVYLIQSFSQLSENLKAFLSISGNYNEVQSTLKQVLDEINQLYEVAIVQRNLKLGQNTLFEQKKKLMKMQSACLKAARI